MITQEQLYGILPPFLQRFISNNGWTFRESQIKAFDALLTTQDHLLLSAGTSGGKTEAALFPTLTSLYRRPSKTIGILYISPLKALINDQFDRVTSLLQDSGIKLTGWHGDISSNKKHALISNPSGILQITPESLQSLLMNHPDEIEHMFGELRYVIIDEVHTFMNSDRGLQLLCELGQIDMIAGCNPRRIGLSATLSDFRQAEVWLRSTTQRDVTTVVIKQEQNYDISIDYHKFPSKRSEEYEDSVIGYYHTILDGTAKYNCIIFANDKETLETTKHKLEKLSLEEHIIKPYTVHHGSISPKYRAEAECMLKDRERNCTALASSTLELGIDVGDLHRVYHIDSPRSCSSFVQKLGRSGRRTGKPVMWILCRNCSKNMYIGINMDLVKAIAITELSLNERWVEPVRYSNMPFGLLFQQTLAYIKCRCDVNLKDLFDDVLTMFPFKNISREDYKILIRHMEKERHIQLLGDGSLILGVSGESIVRSPSFCTSFITIEEFKVMFDKEVIGTVQTLPHIGDIIDLSGRSWNVSEVNHKRKTIKVVPDSIHNRTFWKSGTTDVHTRIMKKMRDVLSCDDIYPYLTECCRTELEQFRDSARKNILFDNRHDDLPYLKGRVSKYLIHPWLGTIQMDTLCRLMKQTDATIDGITDYSIQFSVKADPEEYCDMINDLKGKISPELLVTDEDVLLGSSTYKRKNDEFIPTELLVKAFIRDRIDLSFEIYPEQIRWLGYV